MSERYFSRITLRGAASADSSFWKVFRDPYSLHQSIWNLFSDSPERARDFLYHVADGNRPPVIYAVSARRPIAADKLWQIETKEYHPQVQAGMVLEFFLRANPVITRNGKRHDVVMDAKKGRQKSEDSGEATCSRAEIVQNACGRWLSSRSEQLGFKASALRSDGYQQHSFSKRKQQKPVKFSTVDISGVMEVLDPGKLTTALYEGIGHAKGFGCGMLMVKRSR